MFQGIDFEPRPQAPTKANSENLEAISENLEAKSENNQ
jgi:hypothetical protein